MAAPMLSKPGVQNIIDKTKQKTKKEIKKQKNVLFNPFPFKWPVVEKYFEGRILDELQSLLESLPLKLSKRPLSYFKGKKGKAEEQQQTEEEEKKDEERKELRSQIVCGVREVTKGLERNNLDLVIVCRSTQPSIITKHLIPLAASKSCSALCISEFNRKMAPLLGVTSLVAFGFKKILPGSQSKFEEFVKYAKSVTPAIDAPWVKDISDTPGDSVASSDDPRTDQTQVSDDDDERSVTGNLGENFISLSSSTSKTDDFISLSPAKDIQDLSKKSSKSEDFHSLSPDKDVSNMSTKSASSKIGDSISQSPVQAGNISKKSKSDDFISLSPLKDNTQASKSESSGTLSTTSGKSKDSGFLSLTMESKAPESQSEESPSKNEKSMDTVNRKAELVFPLDGPPPFVPKKDYSYLYVFKSAGKFGDDFISIGDTKGKKRELSLISSESESESVEEEVGGILGIDEPVAKKHKYANEKKHVAYRPASIRTQVANPNKKKRKNKSKGK